MTSGRIDPLRSCPAGVYEDDAVVVSGGAPAGITAGLRPDGRIGVRHRLRPAELDDELAGPLAAALAPLTSDSRVFERAFTGLVLTARPSATAAWELFYRNSLARIRHAQPGYAQVYRHALELLPGTGASVADVGCGFGFLALHLAARGTEVTACDHTPGTAALLRRMAARLGLRPRVVATDGRALPLATGSVDAVALLHVLEHVDEPDAAALLAEAVRVARHRVVVAVPYEPWPTRLFGHVRTVSPAQLGELGARSGQLWRRYEHHGGWLVLDRVPVGRSASYSASSFSAR